MLLSNFSHQNSFNIAIPNMHIRTYVQQTEMTIKASQPVKYNQMILIQQGTHYSLA